MAQTGKGYGVAAAGGGKTLTDLQTICKYHGWHDSTTTGLAALTNFINRTLQQLAILAPWPEYHKRDGRITLATDDEDYVLTDNGDANIQNISMIGSVIRTGWMTPLTEIQGGINEWMLKKHTQATTGWPREYALRKYTSSGILYMEMLVYPKPTSGQNGEYLYFPYRLHPATLVESGDTTDWPTYRLWLLDEALERRIASSNRDSLGVVLEAPDFMLNVRKAMAESRTSYMPLEITEPMDYRHRSIKEIYPVVISE